MKFKFTLSSVLLIAFSNLLLTGGTLKANTDIETEYLVYVPMMYIGSVVTFLVFSWVWWEIIDLRKTDKIEERIIFCALTVVLFSQLIFFGICSIYESAYTFDYDIPGGFKYEVSSSFSWINNSVLVIIHYMMYYILNQIKDIEGLKNRLNQKHG
jgi:hypothetical protein